jgi:hypothetical protein
MLGRALPLREASRRLDLARGVSGARLRHDHDLVDVARIHAREQEETEK